MPDIKKLDKANKLKRNFIRPAFKDTVQVPSGGYTIIRFWANNPGVWFMHCHIDSHALGGMALLLRVGNIKDLPNKPNDWQICNSFKG